MLPGLGMIPLAISSKFSNSFASCSGVPLTLDSIPVDIVLKIARSRGCVRRSTPQRISAHDPPKQYPILLGLLPGRRQICPSCFAATNLQALFCLITPKKRHKHSRGFLPSPEKDLSGFFAPFGGKD